jgi:5'-phosphate synthase pdxT subunit
MTRRLPRIGVLAIQGDFAAHAEALSDLGVEALEIRKLSALRDLDGLVIPGGETTTLLRILGEEGMGEIRDFAAGGGAILGTCAGLILLSREVRDPAQPSLELLDVVVERNAYGRQVDSFKATGLWLDGNPQGARPMEMVFIRAPRILSVGQEVEVLASFDDEPVMVRQGRILGVSFHPELSGDRAVHREFLKLASGRETAIR